jgi:Domain of unknown function (DUF4145)
MAEAWQCPFCDRAATVGSENISTGFMEFNDSNKDGLLKLSLRTVTCPNPKCREYTISASLFGWSAANASFSTKSMARWQLRPQSSARPFPDYIPAPLIADYTEACLIRDLSPKASATLSRRCLQGMIRDFWGVKKGTLAEEINGIKDKVEPAIWAAIDAVRKIGNIGAHMEKDINLVIDVDPDEAQMLIQLVEVLFEEWYIAKKQREDHLANIVAIAAVKKSQKAPLDEQKREEA